MLKICTFGYKRFERRNTENICGCRNAVTYDSGMRIHFSFSFPMSTKIYCLEPLTNILERYSLYKKAAASEVDNPPPTPSCQNNNSYSYSHLLA